MRRRLVDRSNGEDAAVEDFAQLLLGCRVRDLDGVVTGLGGVAREGFAAGEALLLGRTWSRARLSSGYLRGQVGWRCVTRWMASRERGQRERHNEAEDQPEGVVTEQDRDGQAAYHTREHAEGKIPQPRTTGGSSR